MGLTAQSGRKNAMDDVFYVAKEEGEYVIALAGNPNTGKSTVFNYLTGMHQHTGNWPGKTVVNAKGEYKYKGSKYTLVDLPGSYSLFTSSKDEQVARDFVYYGNHDAVVVVADATCLERNLNLLFQIMEYTSNVILCINLIDEAKKKNITINKEALERKLGIKVVLSAARNGTGMEELKAVIEHVALKKERYRPNKVIYSDEIEQYVRIIAEQVKKYEVSNSRWFCLRVLDGDDDFFTGCDKAKEYKIISDEIREKLNLNVDRYRIREEISEENYKYARSLKESFVVEDIKKMNRDKRIDDVITSKTFGIPIMLIVLALIFWITIVGANIPSKFLASILFGFQDKLTQWFNYMNAPEWLHGVLVLGLYRTLAWVVSVMLPPMAIFFPLFTFMEDLGYLPRVAFNMDHLFKKACAHGKQCLTMCMGFGCNAAGVVGCRIIESPRERMIAIITNNFVPCNGRFPTLITLAMVFFACFSSKVVNSLVPVIALCIIIVVGIGITLLVSYIMSKTILKGVPSTFTLELPPYRRPKIWRLIYTSILDRTVFVLSRAMLVAAPAGAVTWLLANINIGGISILNHIAIFLQPVAKLIGLDGFILMAFIVGLPANEIVMPVMLMAYMSTGSLTDFSSIESLKQVLLNNGWTYLTALNTMLFSLLHWPCSTTLWTIKKETGSVKWTVLAAVIPTLIAFVVCFITATIYRLVN